jgi:hypothetical protein
MIDTDKYEGHTPAPWTIAVHTIGKNREITAIVIESNMTTHSNCVLAEVEVENEYAEADAKLIADAPLLLAEVEQLREQNEFLREEVKKDDAGVKAVDALLGGIKNRNEEVKRLREENDELHAQRVQISWIQEARGGQSKAFELLAEVERLREENQRYLDFILWLGIEHKGKKLAWEYGDEKLAEMIE